MRGRLAALASRWTWPVVITAATELVTVGGSGAAGQGFRPLALLLVAAGTPLIARRLPWVALTVSLVATAAYVALGYPAASPYFVGLLVTAYLSADAGARVRTVVFALLIPAVFFALALVPRPDVFVALTLVTRTSGTRIAAGEGVIVAVGLLAGHAAAEWRARAEQQAEQAREAEALQRVSDERLRLARELHDVVSHSIAMINVRASAAVHVMDDRPGEARTALLAIKAASHDALRDLRAVLGVLTDPEDAASRRPAAGLAQLDELVESVRRAGVEVDLSLDLGPAPLPPALDLTTYRVVQEALTNVVRHAPGASTTVSVRREPNLLSLAVEDDGGHPDALDAEGRKGAGQGLEGMRERVRAAGGWLEAGQIPSGGFAVRAMLPLESG